MWPFTQSADTGVPPGSGQYLVGCMDIMSDSSISGSFIRLFYPARLPDKSKDGVTYLPWLPSKEYAQGFIAHAGYNKSGSFASSLLNTLTRRVRIPAIENAPLAQSDSPFPVLIFSHGLAACRTTYSSLCVEMASHGFIIAAVEHRDKSACATYIIKQVTEEDGEVIAPSCGRVQEWIPFLVLEGHDFKIRNSQLNMRAVECIRALDLLVRMNSGEQVVNSLDKDFDARMFKEKMDMNKVGICGHSFGAATSVLTLAKDKRFKCCVALDAWLFPIEVPTYADIDQPILLINTEKFNWPVNVARIRNLVPNFKEPTDDRRMITIMGTVHASQTDFATIFRPSVARFLNFRGSLDPKLAMALNLRATLAFFSSKLDLPYDSEYDKLLQGDNEHVIIGSNIELDPEEYPQANL